MKKSFFGNLKQRSSQILANDLKLIEGLFLGGCPHFPAGYPRKRYRD